MHIEKFPSPFLPWTVKNILRTFVLNYHELSSVTELNPYNKPKITSRPN